MHEKIQPVRTISFLLCVSVVALGAAFYFRSRSESMELQVRQQREEAYSQLLSNVSSLETALRKAQYSASTPMLSQLAAQVWRESAGASSALASLPLDTGGLQEVQKFVNQAGEYAFTLIRRGGRLDAPTYENLAALHASADRLCTQLLDYQPTLGQDLQFGAAVPVSSFQQDAPQQAEYPSLTYDGPFSDHLDQLEPRFLAGQREITSEQALQNAALFAALDTAALHVRGETAGAIPCYCVDAGDISLEVTKQGGHVLMMTDGRPLGKPEMTAEQGARQAARFLERRGFQNMKQSYYEEAEGAVTVNFAPVDQGRTLYPDLVKVTIALDTGDVVGFESRGYVMNHQARQYAAPGLSIGQAREKLSPMLTVVSEGQAVIPSSGANEYDCYEFICQTEDGSHCIVYLDTQTGLEQNILLLLEGENGVLTA